MANGRGLELVNARRSGGRALRVWASSLAAEVLGRATELADAFAQRAADLWQLARSKNHDHHQQDQYQFLPSQIHALPQFLSRLAADRSAELHTLRRTKCSLLHGLC